MPALIREGYVYLAQPPLYKIQSGKETYWALDEADRDKITRDITRRRSNAAVELQRFKGLGEMMPATLNETTLDPERRRLVQVTIPDGDQALTENTISDLMGKDAAPRFEFIMHHAKEADELDI
jgi:DNA gyrase/topoisomerase IV subunit B